MLGVDAPRLATLCLVAVGVQFWVHSFRGAEGPMSDSGFARAILDDLPDGVALVDQDGFVRAVNETLARFIQAAAGQLIGRPIEELVAASVHDLATGFEERELLLRRESDESIPVAISSVQIHDRQGGVIGLVILVRDLRAVVGLRRQLVASGRLAAVGELAAGIAHEVNNPISFILANLNELRRHRAAIESHVVESGIQFEAPPDLFAPGCDVIDDAHIQIRRVAEIVQEVRAFAHAGTGVRGACNLNELLDGVLRLATLRRDRGVAIEVDLRPLPDVVCASQGMKQVFLSLIRRAAAAAGHEGRVRVATRVEGSNAVVCVEDNGLSVPISGPQNLLFDPFDPAVGEWGGLELGISHQLVGEQGGEMWVKPMSSGGTRVRVVMPLRGEPASSHPEREGADA
jgi:PAS domain S-box-containing protein